MTWFGKISPVLTTMTEPATAAVEADKDAQIAQLQRAVHWLIHQATPAGQWGYQIPDAIAPFVTRRDMRYHVVRRGIGDPEQDHP